MGHELADTSAIEAISQLANQPGSHVFFASIQALTNLPALGYRARFEFPEKGSLYRFCCIVQPPSHLFKLASLHMSSHRLNLAVRTTSASCAPALSFPVDNVEGTQVELRLKDFK